MEDEIRHLPACKAARSPPPSDQIAAVAALIVEQDADRHREGKAAGRGRLAGGPEIVALGRAPVASNWTSNSERSIASPRLLWAITSSTAGSGMVVPEPLSAVVASVTFLARLPIEP